MKATYRIPAIKFFFAVTLPFTALNLQAQDEAKPAEYDMAARRQSIVTLEKHIKEREDRLSRIAEDIVRLDTRIENGVSAVVDHLKVISDSSESKSRIASKKNEVIAGLRKVIEFYDSKRRRLKEEAAKANPAISSDILASDIKVFDAKIEKRVDDIMELANSMTNHQDYDKYVKTLRKRRGGLNNYKMSTRKNPEYEQNKQDAARSNQERKELADAVSKSIESLDRRNRDAETKIKTSKLSEGQLALLTEERDLTAELIARRQEQLEQLQNPVDVSTTEATIEESHDIDKLVTDAADDLRQDFDTMFGYYSELNGRRAQLKKLEDNLAARKAWMKEHGAAN